MTTRKHVIEVDVGEGAKMLIPLDLEHELRYGNAEKVSLLAAEVIANYAYLIKEGTLNDMSRRLMRLRQAHRAHTKQERSRGL